MGGRGRQKKGDMETWIEVRHFDAAMSLQSYCILPKNPLYIILDNLRSAFNVGSIFRLCDGMRVSGLYLCGCTAFPPHIKLEKTSMGTIEFVPWKYFDTARDAVMEVKQQGVTVWSAETTSQSCSYLDCPIPEKCALVFGNEACGISTDILALSDRIVEIPLYGFKNSLNVATACAVLGYKVLEKMAGNKKTTASYSAVVKK